MGTGRFDFRPTIPAAGRRWAGLVAAMLWLHVPTAQAEADPAKAAPPEVVSKTTCPSGAGERAARLIQSRYEGIRDIRANFTQTNRSSSFEGQSFMSPEPKAGRVVFAKPGKMRWTYVSPEPSVVVSNGKILWIHDVAAKSITRLEVTAGFLSGAALQFLLGDGQILETFDVTAISCEKDRITLDLLPRAEATYERLGLVADIESGDILGTSVLDLFGNLTEIGFSEIEVNRDPEPETFAVEVPEGVEVIDYRSASEQ